LEITILCSRARWMARARRSLWMVRSIVAIWETPDLCNAERRATSGAASRHFAAYVRFNATSDEGGVICWFCVFC
jgi:hypothetical protein